MLHKPTFKELPYSSFGGAVLLKTLWDRFGFSLLLTQSGIFKSLGIPTWQLAFVFVAGLIARCSSCLRIIQWYDRDPLLQAMCQGRAITQSVFSRFMASAFQWDVFNAKRAAAFQKDSATKLAEGDVIALDPSCLMSTPETSLFFTG